MATVVCQGSQSCLESQVLEPRTLRLRLSSSKSYFSQPLGLTFKPCFLDSKTKGVEEKCQSKEDGKETNISSNADLGCWTFLQDISNGSQLASKGTTEKENTYVHPLIKRSMSKLTEKGLELCTESLGSETGTDIIEDGIFSLSSSESDGGNSPTREQRRSRQLLGAKKASSHSFPPPLTTICGLESLQFRSHREDGRLIIKAAKAPPKHSLLQAERSHGRLRLCFLTESPPCVDSKVKEVSSEEYKEEDNENDYSDNDEEEQEEEEDAETYEDDEENDAFKLEEEMNGNTLEVGDEMGIKTFQRPGRCKEGEPEKRGLLNWESFWVSTS